MKKTEIKKLAKNILAATTKNNEINLQDLGRIVSVLKKDGSPKAVEILNALEKTILRKEKEKQLIIESAFPLEPKTYEALKVSYEKLFGKKLEVVEKENKELIGGIKISNADFVWENSVMSNLTQLKGVITNE